MVHNHLCEDYFHVRQPPKLVVPLLVEWKKSCLFEWHRIGSHSNPWTQKTPLAITCFLGNAEQWKAAKAMRFRIWFANPLLRIGKKQRQSKAALRLPAGSSLRAMVFLYLGRCCEKKSLTVEISWMLDPLSRLVITRVLREPSYATELNIQVGVLFEDTPFVWL